MKPLQSLLTFPNLGSYDCHAYLIKTMRSESSLLREVHSSLCFETFQILLPHNSRENTFCNCEKWTNDIFTKAGLSDSSGVTITCKLLRFLTKEFVDVFVNSYMTVAISNGSLDDEDVVLLMPDGKLYLDLTKRSYELCGLSGKRKHGALKRKCPDVHRYVVTVDLQSPLLQQSTGLRKRIERCFTNTLNQNFTFSLVALEKTSGRQVDYGQYFETFAKIPIRLSCDQIEGCTVPSSQSFAEKKILEPILQWVALASGGFTDGLASTERQRLDPFISLYNSNESFKSCERLCRIQLRGFFSSMQLSCVLQKLGEYPFTSPAFPHAIVNLLHPLNMPLASVSPNFKEHGERQTAMSANATVDDDLSVKVEALGEARGGMARSCMPTTYSHLIEKSNGNFLHRQSSTVVLFGGQNSMLIQ